ncbi:MAG: hypothetical protein WBL63_21895 [Candidatus Acidiferrum sp.]
MKRSQVPFLIILLSSVSASCFAHAQQPQDLYRELREQQDLASANQQAAPAAQDPSQPETTGDGKAATDGTASSKGESPQPKTEPNDSGSGQQTKRILWIIPNYRSVSANTHLPPQSFGDKFLLATQDSFDYSTVIYVGLLSGAAMAQKSEPSLAKEPPAMEDTLPTLLPMEPSRTTWWMRSFQR